MHKVSDTARWFAHWRGATRPPQDDPADWGTAFGLDMSLRALADESEAAAATLRTPAIGAAPSARRRAWMPRLAMRRRPAV